MLNIEKKEPKFDLDEIVYTIERCVSFYVKSWKIKRRYRTWRGNWKYVIDDYNSVMVNRSFFIPAQVKTVKENKLFKTEETANAEALKRNRGE